ncbi:hypothetical protein FUAX_47120 (plasmid) [Fulvitalea axinellae]|uniref:HTH araC/xylS-type domain-containing protein n=2 Tax=Fulvitalea axinellae TaxID=1182444 RepID=A0AAU9DM58_9BACT|nr:hypothetical protein FUAX_47120 [Fulvitalea axinellae]
MPYFYRLKEPRNEMMSKRLRIAVLPLRNESGAESFDYISDGLTEALMGGLSLNNTLRITSRSSVFVFKGSDKPIKEIGESLKVDRVLTGSLRVSDDLWTIKLRLESITEDRVVWEHFWQKHTRDLFGFHDDLVMTVSEAIVEDFGGDRFKASELPERNVKKEAYRLLLKGKYLAFKWRLEDSQKAMEYFEKSIAIDPTLAESYIRLANCLIFLSGTGYTPHTQNFSKAREYIDKALEIDPSLSEGHLALAGISFWRDWNIKGAFLKLKETLGLNPSDAEAHCNLAFISALTGRNRLANKHVEEALILDPFSANTVFVKSWIAYLNKDFESAKKLAKEALEFSSNMMPAVVVYYGSKLMLGKSSEVIEALLPMLDYEQDKATLYGLLGMAYSLEGETERVEEMERNLEESYEATKAERYSAFLFLIYAVKRDEKKAAYWLNVAINSESPLLLFLISDPLIEPIAHIPELRQIRSKLLDHGMTDGSQQLFGFPDSDKAEQEAKRIEDYFLTNKPYLDASLNLKMLSELTDIPSHRLSWLINKRFKKNFNEYVNGYRIQEFKKMANSQEYSHMTLLGLAMTCGFNSKTAFNNAFKKITGLTPKAYMKQVDNEESQEVL